MILAAATQPADAGIGASDWLTVAVSLLSALLGAWFGGRLARSAARETLERTQREERDRAAADRRRTAAVELVGVLLDAREELLAEDGHLLPPDVIAKPLRGLQREVAVRTPNLASVGLDTRISRLLELMPIELATIEQYGPSTDDAQARVAARLAHDRLAYLEWLVTCLQDLAAGRPVPQNVPAPAGIDQPDAPLWIPPTPQTAESAPSIQRREQVRRGSAPGQAG